MLPFPMIVTLILGLIVTGLSLMPGSLARLIQGELALLLAMIAFFTMK